MLARMLPEREFVLYQQYAAKRMLPTRRVEMHFARLCSLLAQLHGNRDARMDQFLFDAIEEVELDEDEVAEHLDFKPRN